MCYYHKTMKPQASSFKLQARRRRPLAASLRLAACGLRLDDRGVATLEGILVVALLAGVLLGCMLLGQWGTHLQSAQMGARLLAFNAGTTTLAKFGRTGDTATQTASTGRWDTLTTGLPTSWLNTMFTSLNDDYLSGRVKGRQRGRLASRSSPSLFDFSSASVSYFSTSAAASNPWSGTAASAKSTFMGIAYYVGRYRVNPQTISSKQTVPLSTVPALETIYVRSGVR
jgi:hypothetical protein